MGTDAFPEKKVLFFTEELYPQSKVVNEMCMGPVLGSGNGVPFAQTFHHGPMANRALFGDRHMEPDGLLAVTTYRGDFGLGACPIHDGNRNSAACSHGV